jgi:NADH-ubiquinone oxidoreductase chain 5
MILILLFPLISFLISNFFGRFLGKGACFIAVLKTFSSFLFSCIFAYKIIFLGLTYKVILSPWIKSDFIHINWSFQFDTLSIVMLLIITFISTIVHLYSLEYMEYDPHLIRFMSYLSLFTFFMLILVTGDNFLQMFVGWEGVGLSSYLLINFWFTRIQANKAAIKAMLVNRVGDFCILLALFLMIFVFNSLEYDIIFGIIPNSLNLGLNLNIHFFSYIDLITILIFLGCMGKSAQLGLHTWLPDAMEGPTPVSALIHAATMVTAGVFLIVRSSFLFEMSSTSLCFILVIGSLTTFFSSTVGLFQNDIKKIIAYSTCSQLGYMIFACGLSSYDVAMFHLSNHAFFKALLFLGAGSIIHAMNDEQDLRKYGGLKNLLPFSYSIFLIGSLALMGIPFLSGFYSKDTILEIAYSKCNNFSHFAYLLGTLSVFSTAYYSVRLLCLVFLNKPNGSRQIILNAHEPNYNMSFSLFILFVFSVFVGFFTKDLFIGFGSPFWRNSIFIIPSNYAIVDIEFISLFPKLLPLLLTFLGAISAFLVYVYFSAVLFKVKNTKFFNTSYNFFNRKWYFDRLYNQLFSQIIFDSSFFFFYKDVDRGLIEQFGPFGLVNLFISLSNNIKTFDKGKFFHYQVLLFFFVFSIFILLVLFYSFSNFIDVFLLLCLCNFFSIYSKH